VLEPGSVNIYLVNVPIIGSDFPIEIFGKHLVGSPDNC
jgi:hypothetical protein